MSRYDARVGLRERRRRRERIKLRMV